MKFNNSYLKVNSELPPLLLQFKENKINEAKFENDTGILLFDILLILNDKFIYSIYVITGNIIMLILLYSEKIFFYE